MRSRLRRQLGDLLALSLLVASVLFLLTAVVVAIITLVVVPGRIPVALAAYWPVYLLVLSTRLAAVLALPWAGSKFLPADAARPHLAPEWLRRRLTALRKLTVSVVVAPDHRRRTFARYHHVRPVLLVDKKHARARGAEAYAAVASSLARLLLLEERRGFTALCYLTAAARQTGEVAAGLLVGAAVVGVPALRAAAIGLFAFAALAQLASTAFELVVARRAASELRADPELAGAGAEIAVHTLRYDLARHIVLGLSLIAITALAAPVTAAAPPPLALLAAAPPLTGIALWLAKLAALSCLVGGGLLLFWRRLPLPLMALGGALGVGNLLAIPTLVVLTWDQGFAVAHPWAIALAAAAAWPGFSAVLAAPLLVLGIPLVILFRKRLASPAIFLEPEPPLDSAAKLARLSAPPTVGPPPSRPHHLLLILWDSAVLFQSIPLAYLALGGL